jgi:hypothetical protein
MVRSFKFGTYGSKTMFYAPHHFLPHAIPKENVVHLDKK